MATRCILWVSPFSGDEPLNIAGSITDPTVQATSALRRAGGRLMVSGQEVVSSLTFNGQANNGVGSFVYDVLNARLNPRNNSGNNQTLPAAAREPDHLRLAAE